MANRNVSDIVELIKQDHEPLKDMIEIMKSDGPLADKKAAFDQFVPTLLLHAHPEEESMYEAMKTEDELRDEGFEGYAEHEVAERLADEIRALDDEDEIKAKIKVLAELVEHHIEEEESEMLPGIEQRFSEEERRMMGENYLLLRDELGSSELNQAA